MTRRAQLAQPPREHRTASAATEKVARAILSGCESDDVLDLVARLARGLVGADLVTITTAEAEDLVVRATVGAQAPALQRRRVSMNHSLAGEVFRTGRPIFVPDAQSDDRADAAVTQAGNFGPVLVVPMAVGDQSIGIIIVANQRGTRGFSADDLEVVRVFAAQAALSVEFGRLIAEHKRAEDRLRAVMEVTSASALVTGLESEEAVLKVVASRSRDLVGATAAAVITPEPGGQMFVARAADGRWAHLAGLRIPDGRAFLELSAHHAMVVDELPGGFKEPVQRAGESVGTAIAVPLLTPGRLVGTIIVMREAGHSSFAEDDIRTLELFAAQAAMSIEQSRIRGGLQRLATANLAVKRPLGMALDAIARTVVEATATVACGVFLLDSEQRLRTGGTFGLPAGFVAAMDAIDVTGARRPSMQAVESRTTVVLERAVDRLLADPGFASIHPMLVDVSWDTIVSLPLLHEGRVGGALSCYYRKGQELGDTELALLKVVADQAASVAENARLFAVAQDMVALEERQRLARELHDSVSQALYGIALGARTAKGLLGSDPARLADPLDYVLQMAEIGLAEMRALIFELRPESLEREGLAAALEKQVAAVRARYSLAVQAAVTTEPVTSLPVKEALLRISQEALHNIAKHAKASQVTLRLETNDPALVLQITDDGIGFDPEEAFPGHLGLPSMRERAEKLGGRFEVSSSPGHGTRITVSVPLAASG